MGVCLFFRQKTAYEIWLGLECRRVLFRSRAESLDERPMFREALAERRCLVPVTGIYVWQAGLRGKQPFLVTHTDRSPLMLAGIWSRYAPDLGTSREARKRAV